MRSKDALFRASEKMAECGHRCECWVDLEVGSLGIPYGFWNFPVSDEPAQQPRRRVKDNIEDLGEKIECKVEN